MPSPNDTGQRRRTDAGSFTSIGKGATLRGRLSGSGLAIVHGLLEGGGEWYGEMVVAEGGRVVATDGLRARRLRVEGSTAGLVEATELLEVVTGSRVEGEVRAAEARIERGARPAARVSLGALAPRDGC